jgi:hypothetical protein
MKIPPHHWQRARRYWWDAVALIALCGIVYGTNEYIEVWGLIPGLIMSVMMAVAGYLAAQICYPLWFRD